MSRFPIKQAAVLGAGVMGAQIAAHLVNARVPVILFDLPAKEGPLNGVVTKALANLGKLDPAPAATKDLLTHIDAANYEQHLTLLEGCDFIVEAIAERMDWKLNLFQKIAPHVNPRAILASNTSGLSINAMADALPAKLQAHFCGVHFFNPPRYMHLVEIVPTSHSDPAMLDALETFLVTGLGKGVIRAKDTPNFVANRVGVFSMLATMHHAQRLNLGFDLVDALTGPGIGRPKSATFRTADVVGLDTFAHVVKTMADTLPADPWHDYFETPAWLNALIAQGALGQKTKGGIYRKVGKEIQVLDLSTQDYRSSAASVDPEVQAILKIKHPKEKFARLQACEHPQAEFLWAIFRDVFHYCAYHLADIAHNARDLDLAIRWGFGWQQGPFETWQAAGWQELLQRMEEDIASGQAMSSAPLPGWAKEADRDGVHQAEGSYAAASGTLQARSTLPVYRRQAFPDAVLGEHASVGVTVFQNEGLRAWHAQDGVLVASITSKMHTLGAEVIEGLIQAVELAEAEYQGLVIWNSEAPFSAGANLAALAPYFAAGDWAKLDQTVAQFQQAMMRIKYAQVPVIAAAQGLALGGGCELLQHCSRVVAHLELYAGLVEVGVGLLPAGGGLKEAVLRAHEAAQGGDTFPFLQRRFQAIAMGTVAKSAEEARQLGYLRPTDLTVLNAFELLHVARQQAIALHESGYRPPLRPRAIPVTGRTGRATLEMMLVNMAEGGFISAHDYRIGKAIATVLGGGEVDSGSAVDETWLLRLEREQFMALLQTPETQARIQHMLESGKPLRN